MSMLRSVSAKIDSDLFDVLTVPARQADYPRDSLSFVRIDTSLRAYWHTLFDVCPQLLELAPPDGLAIFRPFMAWAAEQGLSLNWTYYLWVADWLRQSEFYDRLDDGLLLALMGASAARWAVVERDSDCGIVLGHTRLASLVVGWKCRRIDSGRVVECIDLEESLPDPGEPFGYFTVPTFELHEFPGWHPIPH